MEKAICNIPLIIPSFEPERSFVEFCEKLFDKGLTNTIIVDDGSGAKYHPVFCEIEQRFHFTVLHHAVNLGKGRALKTAFNYVLNGDTEVIGVVTADSDGQHTPIDIKRCIDQMAAHPHNLILGCRSFEGGQVPWKSRFGNELTKKVFYFVSGVKVSDTQTGLRGIPREFMKKLMNVSGERFEFETNMLIESKSACFVVDEISIQTVYDSKDEHKTHFDPIKDSIRIYRVLLMHALSSFFSAIFDFIVFSFVAGHGLNIWRATAVARVCSSIINFTINKKAVFKVEGDTFKQAVKYMILVIISGMLSATVINAVTNLLYVNVIVVKAVVETALFFLNFYIQRAFIFVLNSDIP